MNKINPYAILAFLLWFAHLVNLYIWLRLDVNYMTYDSHSHFLLSLKMFEETKRLGLDIFSRYIALPQRHPPLVMMVTMPFYFIFGISQDAGVLINSSIFLGILIYATYKIGTIILSPKAGLLAAFILTMYPVVFNQLKVYMLDLPLTAMVSLSIYFLIRADNFRNLKYTMLLLISLFSGILIKVNFIIFLLSPLIYISIRRLSSSKLQLNSLSLNIDKKKLTLLTLFFILILLIGLISLGFWYYFSPRVFIANIGRGSFIEKLAFFSQRLKFTPWYLQTWPTTAPQNFVLRRLHAFFWYFWGLINWQVSFFFFILFFIGGFLFIKYKFPYKTILFLWVIGSFFLLINLVYGIGINMEVSAVRYSMPLLPAIALMSAVGISQITMNQLRRLLIITTVLFGIIQFAFASYPIGVKFRKVEIPLKRDDKKDFFPSSLILFNPAGFAVSGGDSGSHPRNFKEEELICRQILDVISSSNNNKEALIAVIPDDTRLWYLEYLVYIQKKPFNIVCNWANQYIKPTKRKYIDYTNLILKSDYIIDKEGGWQGEAYVQLTVSAVRDCFNAYKNNFSLLKEIEWPDKSKIFIYKKIIN